MSAGVRNAVWWTAGLGFGSANSVRHRLRGYRTPRTFSSTDWDRAYKYAFRIVDRWHERSGVDFTGKRVLEIGPGPDLGTGAVMIQRGAIAYTAVDQFPLAVDVPAAFYQRFGVDPSRLGYVNATYPELPELDGRFDLIVSNSCLEHVDDVPRLFARLASVTTEMVHHVDAKAHMRFFDRHDPLNAHRYGDAIYDRLLTFPGSPNRLLADDYVLAAEKAGFHVTKVVPGTVAEEPYLNNVALSRRFAGRSDLSLLSFTLVCRLSIRKPRPIVETVGRGQSPDDAARVGG
jgi:hypothetical protein